ncbi:recombinase family protein [Rhodococcus sp. PD04]|uniref:recombinase family protein n=1 Tax=Rhodococcus sp. PD04 TaxID=3109594 RepID=UPI002DDA5CF3|nr:recombinase family protein [Rhodococcus sp. PD04]WSE22359.1 recombinase family protein [Rhodococcus sp. PD04]
MRALIYARISNDREGAGLGVDRQIEDCRELAGRLGWNVAGVLSDNDISAYSGKPRPAYRELLDALRDGRANAVIAWHSDRLHRSNVELEEFIEVCEKNAVAVETVKAGKIDLSTPTGRMIARIVGAVARHEVEHAKQRVVAAQEQAARDGKPHGPVPFGYMTIRDDSGRELSRVPHPTEAQYVREAIDRVLAGESLYSIRMDWTKRGITPRSGRPWSPHTFRQMLIRPVYAGLRSHKGVTTQGTWEPLISLEDHHRLVSLLTAPSRVSHRGTEPKYLLTGIAKCGVCGSPMWRLKRKSGGLGNYTCTENRCTARVIERVDEHVEEAVLRWLESSSSVDELGDPDAAKALAEARELRARLDGFVEDAIAGKLDRETLSLMESKTLPRIRELEKRAQQSGPHPIVRELLGVEARVHWSLLSLADRRAVIRHIAKITIFPARRGNKFDPETIRVDWV